MVFVIHPWEQQVRETAKAFAAFTVYRDLGPQRTLEKAAVAARRAYKGLAELSAKHAWVERAKAWDRENDRAIQEELRKEQVAAGKRHAQFARNHLAVLNAPAVELARRIQAGELDMRKLDTKTLVRLTQMTALPGKALTEVERLAIGMSTQQHALTGPDGQPLVMTATVTAAVKDLFTVPDDAPPEPSVAALTAAPDKESKP